MVLVASVELVDIMYIIRTVSVVAWSVLSLFGSGAVCMRSRTQTGHEFSNPKSLAYLFKEQ